MRKDMIIINVGNIKDIIKCFMLFNGRFNCKIYIYLTPLFIKFLLIIYIKYTFNN